MKKALLIYDFSGWVGKAPPVYKPSIGGKAPPVYKPSMGKIIYRKGRGYIQWCRREEWVATEGKSLKVLDDWIAKGAALEVVRGRRHDIFLRIYPGRDRRFFLDG